tara:strand:+ start:2490 stop:2645 length:156 start_codon:yes stop_codon:yes gene_type:complete
MHGQSGERFRFRIYCGEFSENYTDMAEVRDPAPSFAGFSHRLLHHDHCRFG